MTSTIVGLSMAAIAAGKSGGQGDALVWGGIGGLVGLYIGVAWVTPEILAAGDPEIKTLMYELRRGQVSKKNTIPPDVPVIIRAESKGGNQVDFFHGLTPEQWHKCAISIAAARDFTVATVGQVERPKLIPMMKAAEYIESAGEGKYKLTMSGLCFWQHLARLPYPWEHAPQKLRNLAKNGIYTQYIRQELE